MQSDRRIMSSAALLVLGLVWLFMLLIIRGALGERFLDVAFGITLILLTIVAVRVFDRFSTLLQHYRDQQKEEQQ